MAGIVFIEESAPAGSRPRWLDALVTRLPAVLSARERLRSAVDRALDRAVRRLRGHAYLAWSVLACARDALWLRARGDRRLPFSPRRNWTNQPSPTGLPLAALAALWLAGRVLVTTPYAWAAAWSTLRFPSLRRSLWRSRSGRRNRRNYFFVGLLLLMGRPTSRSTSRSSASSPSLPGSACSLASTPAVHHGGDGRPRHPDVHQQRRPRARRGADDPRRRRSRWAGAGLLAADALRLEGAAYGPRAGAAAAHAVRWAFWQPWQTLRPLVWILHAGYAWIPFTWRSRRPKPVLASSPPTHALTAGAIGALSSA